MKITDSVVEATKALERAIRIVAQDAGAQFLYHGTSSKHLPSILKHGFSQSKNYFSTNPHRAHEEAQFATEGDKFSDKKGAGGKPVVVVVNRHHPSIKGSLKVDSEYNSGDKQNAFYTHNKVHPSAIVHQLVPETHTLAEKLSKRGFLNKGLNSLDPYEAPKPTVK